jgi:putative transcriptional regulator
MQTVDLTHHFLIAMPAMTDPYFAKSLTYVCEHNEQGAMGVVINKTIDMTLGGLLEQIGLEVGTDGLASQHLYFGGPVQMDRGFVLHRPVGHWQSTLAIKDGIALTTSKDILQAVARGEGPDSLLVTLGYAGWGAGQLEQELSQNAWLTVPADARLIFDLPVEERFEAAIHALGVDPSNLAEEAGHA